MGSTSELFLDGSYDPDTLALLTAVFNEAWGELTAPGEPDGTRVMMRQLVATRIVSGLPRCSRSCEA